jgi:hypothetical protein
MKPYKGTFVCRVPSLRKRLNKLTDCHEGHAAEGQPDTACFKDPFGFLSCKFLRWNQYSALYRLYSICVLKDLVGSDRDLFGVLVRDLLGETLGNHNTPQPG